MRRVAYVICSSLAPACNFGEKISIGRGAQSDCRHGDSGLCHFFNKIRTAHASGHDARIVAYTSMRTNIVLEEKLIEELLQPVR